MKTDVQIAQDATLKPITEIASQLNIDSEELELYGKYKGKISYNLLKRLSNEKDGKLILVTAINPTPAGEGKTTTNIGLAMALSHLGHKAISTLREPSLGPCFGIKGGAAGGGYSQILPMEDINLHFTGDFHAITSAHNLLAAMVDNSLYQGNPLNIDPKRILWKRVVDMNDRALRSIVLGLGPKENGVARESSFDITVASEIMAILCLTTSITDLKFRLSKIIVAFDVNGKPVTAGDLKAVGAMALLLKDAIKPNLVQTLENTPAIVHGGPFANIAHGCNSILATKTALKLGDYVVTEAGFGADLGAEKFFDIKCRYGNLKPDAVVLVATVRSLKYNGQTPKENLETENLEALEKGFVNLKKHIANIKKYNVPLLVALNKFPTDTDKELSLLVSLCQQEGVDVSISEVFSKGGHGAIDLAQKVVRLCDNTKSSFSPLYDASLSINEKITTIAKEIYGAKKVEYTADATKQMSELEKLGLDKLPICIAKTQYSFSDNPQLLGAPSDFNLTVRELKVAAGAGFIVAITGEIMTMPGLPKEPMACKMNISDDGTIIGLS